MSTSAWDTLTKPAFNSTLEELKFASAPILKAATASFNSTLEELKSEKAAKSYYYLASF